MFARSLLRWPLLAVLATSLGDMLVAAIIQARAKRQTTT